MHYILSSSDDSIGIGTLLIFIQDQVLSISESSYVTITLKDGSVYEGYDLLVVEDGVIKPLNLASF